MVKVGVRSDGAERLFRQQRLLLHAHRPPGNFEVFPQFLHEEDFPQSRPSVVLVMLIWNNFD